MLYSFILKIVIKEIVFKQNLCYTKQVKAYFNRNKRFLREIIDVEKRWGTGIKNSVGKTERYCLIKGKTTDIMEETWEKKI